MTQYILTYGQESSLARAGRLVMLAIVVVVSLFVVREVDGALGISWDEATPTLVQFTYDMTRIACGAVIALSYTWLARSRVMHVTRE